MSVGFYKNCLYTTDISSALKKNNNNKKSQYMVSHPETSSDSPIGSDRESGRHNTCMGLDVSPKARFERG